VYVTGEAARTGLLFLRETRILFQRLTEQLSGTL